MHNDNHSNMQNHNHPKWLKKWDFHGGEYQYWGLLRCDATHFYIWTPTFHMKLMPPSSGKKQPVSITYWNPCTKLHGIASYMTVSWLKWIQRDRVSLPLRSYDISVIAKILPLKGPGWSVKEIKFNNTQTPHFINYQFKMFCMDILQIKNLVWQFMFPILCILFQYISKRCNITQFILYGDCSTCFRWYHHTSSERK
jgi:hypothetical protein